MDSDDKLSKNGLSIWDQTVGCDQCNRGWWAENYTDDPTLFHDPTCPLFGDRDEADQAFNLSYIEKELGRTVGFKTEAEMKQVIRLYVDKSIKERGEHYRALHAIAEELGIDLKGVFGFKNVRDAISKHISERGVKG